MGNNVAYIDCRSIADEINRDTDNMIHLVKKWHPDFNGPAIMFCGYPDEPENRIFSNGLRKDAEALGISVYTDLRDGDFDGFITFHSNANGVSLFMMGSNEKLNVDSPIIWGTSAVTEAVWRTILKTHLERLTGKFVLVVGRGVVGRSICNVVRSYHALGPEKGLVASDDVATCITSSKTDPDRLYNLMEAADIIITAASPDVKFKIDFHYGSKERFPDTTTIIDVGNNIDHSSFTNTTYNRNIVVTPAKGGIGVITRAIVLNRIALNTIHRFALNELGYVEKNHDN